MLFFIFFLFLLVSFELFLLNTTALYLLYSVYTIMFVVTYNNTNIVPSVNFKYLLKSFLNRFLGFFYVFYSSLFAFFLYFKKNPQLKWKPLFKRSSYFGLYRSTRNQYLNK